MENYITFANSKARRGVISNIAITFCVLVWVFNSNVAADYSAENLIIRYISPWVVVAATSVAALCNYLWLKNKGYHNCFTCSQFEANH